MKITHERQAHRVPDAIVGTTRMAETCQRFHLRVLQVPIGGRRRPDMIGLRIMHPSHAKLGEGRNNFAHREDFDRCRTEHRCALF